MKNGFIYKSGTRNLEDIFIVRGFMLFFDLECMKDEFLFLRRGKRSCIFIEIFRVFGSNICDLLCIKYLNF